VSVLTLAPSCLFSIDAHSRRSRSPRCPGRLVGGAGSGRRLYETLQQTAINAFGTVKQRVASHLLDLASSQPQPRTPLVATVSQRELADAVGSVREVVARVLRELRGRVVATGTDSVVILDPARLHDGAWPVTAR
jgi:CRP/FNR family transcriptional regulator